MNSFRKNPQFSLHIPPLMWQSFRSVMEQAQTTHEEVIGFLFCERHRVFKNHIRYIPKTWVVPTPDCYEYQSEVGLVLKQHFHHYLLKHFLETEQWDMVHIHTHAHDGDPNFSAVDDRYESEYARFLASTFTHKPRLISGVFDEALEHHQFRIWDLSGKAFHPLTFYSGWWEQPIAKTRSIDSMFSRQRIFGETFQNHLAQLTVTLIGCGGIGATFAEQLGRLGVKQWILIDPDRLEPSNLNRMPGATSKMADQQWYKVDYVKHLIKRIYTTGSSVWRFPSNIESCLAEKKVAASDLIVVATDNHASRQVAQELALKYLRPLISLGTHIEVNNTEMPRMYCRITIPPLDGGWCLMCGNMINLQQAALESAPEEVYEVAANRGYINDVSDPAVFWLNSICASTAAGVIQGGISGCLDWDKGLDWIYEFPRGSWLKTNPDALQNPDCFFCGQYQQIGLSNYAIH